MKNGEAAKEYDAARLRELAHIVGTVTIRQMRTKEGIYAAQQAQETLRGLDQYLYATAANISMTTKRRNHE
jgi:hypothetical protein